jgi:hypothetical protein
MLQERLEVFQNACHPTPTFAVFPETLEKQAEKGTQFTDEVWVTGKNGVINQMMLSSYLEKE